MPEFYVIFARKIKKRILHDNYPTNIFPRFFVGGGARALSTSASPILRLCPVQSRCVHCMRRRRAPQRRMGSLVSDDACARTMKLRSGVGGTTRDRQTSANDGPRTKLPVALFASASCRCQLLANEWRLSAEFRHVDVQPFRPTSPTPAAGLTSVILCRQLQGNGNVGLTTL